MRNFYLIALFSCFSILPAWGAASPEKAVLDLIERVTPGYASQYRLEIIGPEAGNDVYEVDGDGRQIILRGNNAVSLATAFNWYLKYTCRAHVSWFGNQLNLPAKLPQPAWKERRVIHGELYGGMVGLGTLAAGTGLYGYELHQYAPFLRGA